MILLLTTYALEKPMKLNKKNKEKNAFYPIGWGKNEPHLSYFNALEKVKKELDKGSNKQ